MSKYKIEIISIDKLIINPENFRFDPVENQKEAIIIMVKEQKKKLLNLSKDILEYGLNPSELPIVFPKNNNYIVLEGNRRVTSLKLLCNPDLLKDLDEKLYNHLIKLLKVSSNDKLDKAISCVVFENENHADRWIKLKHTGENDGKGTVSWDAKAKRRFDQRTTGTQNFSLQILNFIKNSNKFNDYIRNNIEKISLTNIDRLISDPFIRESLGLCLKDNKLYKLYPDEELVKGLSKITKDLLNKKIVVKDIYYKSNRLDYINTFSENELPNKNKEYLQNDILPALSIENTTSAESIEDTSFNNINKKASDSTLNLTRNESLTTIKDATNSSNNKKRKDKKTSYIRKYLIPTTLHIKINNRRINNIYKELKILDVDIFTNATAVLLRVFIELSLDEYIKTQNITNLNNNTPLNKKLQSCLDDLKSKNLITRDEAKPINTSLSSPTSILSINTFNSYVHNSNLFPSPKELKITWDNLENFITILFNTLLK